MEEIGSKVDKPFSFIRGLLWPIRKREMPYFAPLCILATLIMFNYTILHNIKDTLVLSHIGANAIPFLKLYFTTPAAFILIVLFTKLSGIFSRKKLFYIFISPFIIFFTFYAFFIYPNIDYFNPSVNQILSLKHHYPKLKALIDIYSNWTLIIVFVLCELWQVIMLSVLFWQFANSTINISDSKRFYTMFVVFINSSPIVIGSVIRMQKEILDFFGIKYSWPNVFKMQILIFFIISIFIIITYRKACKVVDGEKYSKIFQEDAKNSINNTEELITEKRSLKYNFKLIIQSKHLILLASLLIFFGIMMNFIDIQWKNAVVKSFHSKKEMNLFFTKQSMWISFWSVTFTWIVASGMLRNMNWLVRSLITPVIMIFFGSFMFIRLIFGNADKQSLKQIVDIGFYTIMFFKISKYAFFDTAKEMAFIPLSNNLKINGKAAVEIIGGRLGKSTSSLIQTLLLIFMSTASVMDISGILYLIFLLIGIIWIICVKNLNSIINESK